MGRVQVKGKNQFIYTQEELPQGSPEWKRFYQMTLGGSETACLMFAAYKKTIHGLWEEKVAARRGVIPQPLNDADDPTRLSLMERGNRLEPMARDAYARKFKCKVEQLCLVHPEMQFLRTSLDGIKRNRRVILEIKCPKDETNHKKFTKGEEMPSWRYPQTQHQIGVVAAHFPQIERVDYVSYLVEEDEKSGKIIKTDMKVIPVYPDWDYINELFRRARVFMDYVIREERPPVNIFREGEKLIARAKPLPKQTNKTKGYITKSTTPGGRNVNGTIR